MARWRTLRRSRVSTELGPGAKPAELGFSNNEMKWILHLYFSYLVLILSFQVAV